MNNENINNWSIKDFEKLPLRNWNEDIGNFDSLVILPIRITLLSILRYNLKQILFNIACLFFKPLNIKKPEIYEIDGLHDSGFRCMDFIAIKNGKPTYRLSGCSDVIHLDGIGGRGFGWFSNFNIQPKFKSWNMDCLAKSGLLRIWCSSFDLKAGEALSSFEVYAIKNKE